MPNTRVREVAVSSLTRKLIEEEQTCPVCGETYWGVKTKRYCSRLCQNKADYQKHAAARKQERREKYKTTGR
jgi:hypothetical protein